MSPVRRIAAVLVNVLLLHLLWVGSAGACGMMRADGMPSPAAHAAGAHAIAPHAGDCVNAVSAPSATAPAAPCTHGHMAGSCTMMAQCAPASLQGTARVVASSPLRGEAPRALLAGEHAAPALRPTPPPPRV